MTPLRRLTLAALVSLPACDRAEPALAGAQSARPQAPPEAQFSPCGEVMCQPFASALDALGEALRNRPLVVAVGEAHARKDAPAVESTARRFGHELLPELVRRGARQLVVELLVPATGCEPELKAVRRAEHPIVAQQAESNQDDYVWLGQSARSLGVVPYVLEPTCADYARVGSGEDAVFELMRLVRNQAGEKLTRFAELALRAAPASDFVLAYGGALHNDAAPRPERAAWSFGPELLQRTGGRYVELDLILPELVQDNDAWRSQPWYSHYLGLAEPRGTLLYRMGPASFTLVLATKR
jgi:hypothetical protein